MKPSILLVDDDVLLLRSLKRVLQEDFQVTTAETAQLAFETIAEGNGFAVVVSDFKMPVMDGVQFLDRWSFLAPDTIRIMLTGQADLTMAIDAVNKGHIFRFLTKPINGDDLRLVLRDAVNQFQLVQAERVLLEQTLTGSVQTLMGLLSLFDPSGFGRGKEVRDLAIAVAARFSVDAGWDIGLAALLAGVGWLAIPVDVQAKVNRGERLSTQESEMLFRSPAVAAELISNIPRLQLVAEIIKYTRKDFNGTGYPKDQLSGSDLPLGSRILRVVQDYTNRLRVRKSKVVVFTELEAHAGQKYDPDVLRALGEVIQVSNICEAERHVLLALEELKPGMVLGDDIYTKDSEVIVLPRGTHLNLFHIERLRNYSAGRRVSDPVLINRTV